MKSTNKIAIIGAGITGVTTAYALSKRGFEVTVYDRNRYAAMETFFANGGNYRHPTPRSGTIGLPCSGVSNGCLSQVLSCL